MCRPNPSINHTNTAHSHSHHPTHAPVAVCKRNKKRTRRALLLQRQRPTGIYVDLFDGTVEGVGGDFSWLGVLSGVCWYGDLCSRSIHELIGVGPDDQTTHPTSRNRQPLTNPATPLWPKHAHKYNPASQHLNDQVKGRPQGSIDPSIGSIDGMPQTHSDHFGLIHSMMPPPGDSKPPPIPVNRHTGRLTLDRIDATAGVTE